MPILQTYLRNELGIDVVLGVVAFMDLHADGEAHIAQGQRKCSFSSGTIDLDATVVFGVNQHELKNSTASSLMLLVPQIVLSRLLK